MVFNVADSPSFAALVDPCIACVLALILHMHISCRMSSPACRMRCSAYAHMCAGAARVCAQAPRAGTQYCMRASAALECDSCQPIWPWGAGRWARGAGHAPANPDLRLAAAAIMVAIAMQAASQISAAAAATTAVAAAAAAAAAVAAVAVAAVGGKRRRRLGQLP